MFRPFPADELGRVLQGQEGVAVLERLDQPLAVDSAGDAGDRARRSPSAWRTAATPGRAIPELAAYRQRRRRPGALLGLLRHGQPRSAARGHDRCGREHAPRRRPQSGCSTSRSTSCRTSRSRPNSEIYQQTIEEAYPHVRELASPRLRESEPDAGRAASRCAFTPSAAGERSRPARTWR